MKRKCKIDRIGDQHRMFLKDFVIFYDAFINEYDKLLEDEQGNIFKILEYTTFEENVLVTPETMPYVNGWRMIKKAAVRLDRIPTADYLYIKNRI